MLVLVAFLVGFLVGSVVRFPVRSLVDGRGPRRVWVLVACVGLASLTTTGCASSNAPSPFFDRADGSAEAGSAPRADSGSVLPETGEDAGAPGEWGGPCVDDGQCDDGVDCTADACDLNAGRCHFTADDTACDDGVYCNGAEACVPAVGCRPGDPVACSDGTACTIDSCEEDSRTCLHVPRDADGDGDPDGNCEGGGDCNDTDPSVSSREKEVCSDGVDNDCDGDVDESDCVDPRYDRCSDALVVEASGSFALDATVAHTDYAASCLPRKTQFRDLVVSIVVPKGDPQDVDVAATVTDANGDGVVDGDVALASSSRCGDASSELDCATFGTGQGNTRVARLLLHGLAPGKHPVTLFTTSTSPVALAVAYETPPAPAPLNETCGTAESLAEGEHAVVRLAGAQRDLTTACDRFFADLVYEVTLDSVRDLHVYASSLDAYGTPIVSLRGASCTPSDAEIACHEDDAFALFRRAVPAGRYYLAVGSTGPGDVDVVFETSAPTSAPPDENCDGAPSLTPNEATVVDLAAHVDDVQLGCGIGTPDAAYSLHLSEVSDVLLLESVSTGDRGAIALAGSACETHGDLLSCGTSSRSLVRAPARAVAPGDYSVVVESNRGSPVAVTALVRPATPTTFVPFADVCETAVDIPPGGGTFQGNTANATQDFVASCDVGGTGQGAPDQILHLRLDARSRVVLDGRDSDYAAIIDVRSGGECPGTEVPGGCSEGAGRDPSFVDLDLDAGDYWVQIDGYRGASGAWSLDAYVAEVPGDAPTGRVTDAGTSR